ncbi:hypothetical protein Hanom_Chr12g01073241 [Helianthus anomalus]
MFPLKSMGTSCNLSHWMKVRLNHKPYNSEKEGEVTKRLGQPFSLPHVSPVTSISPFSLKQILCSMSISKHSTILPLRYDMTSQHVVYILLTIIIHVRGSQGQIYS